MTDPFAKVLSGLRVVDPGEGDDRDTTETRRVRALERLARLRAPLEPRIQSDLLERLRAEESPAALLMGPTGCGKTSAAHWLMARVRKSARFVTSAALTNAEREHRLGDGPPPLVDQCRTAPYLVLDDVGMEREVFAVQDMLNVRYESSLPVIVTTGLTRREFVDRFGAPYVRRCVEQHTGHAVIVWNGYEAAK